MRRGFKAESERKAQAIRQEMGLSAKDRLNSEALASHFGIRVVPLTALRDLVRDRQSIDRLMDPEAKFSALTVCAGEKRLIVYNPADPPGRQLNSLAHELSHLLLGHPPSPPTGSGSCRVWNSEQEEEADWLAGALLVPREGALWWMRQRGDIGSGARHFGVSKSLFRWRVNHTGVIRQLASSQGR
jgi:Zn-dependent peptidase ImmA (M78 family)